MEIALLLARLALAGVFLVAGIAKLADRNGSSNAIAGFGMPQRLAGPLGAMLPIAEIAVATLLLPASTARWGAIGALALVMISNPMCPGTGHRNCNDCMKDCIYQKQETVKIPQI